MQMATEELAGGVTKAILDGRLDIAGAEAVDLKMNVIAGSKKFVLIDMRRSHFSDRGGLRAIFSTARAIKGRGGKMVLFGPDTLVEKA